MKTYLIFGKGKSGKAAAALLESKNIPHLLVDDKTPNWERFLKEVSTIVVSPGIPPHHRVFKLAQKLGKELIGETELAFRFWKGQIVAITGTDGKSTTTRLIYEILKTQREDVYIGGNYGTPFSEIVLKQSKSDYSKDKPPLAVLEISSFQGKTLKTFRPNIGVFLNFSPDHLDWHSSLKDYLLSKWNIFKNQREEDFLIVNRCQKETLQTPARAKKITFGCNGDIYIDNHGRVYFNDIFLFEEKDILLKGKHNLFNAAVAATVGYLLGVEIYNIQRAIREFKGLPHRLEYVGKFGGIEIYNDSKATTPHALEAALKSFKKRVVLIAGGKDKGADFGYLKPLVREKVKIAILYGENSQKIARQWEGSTKIYTVGNLEDALHLAKKLLQRGNILLFSPASASFDSFSSYIERGEVFKKLVKELFK